MNQENTHKNLEVALADVNRNLVEAETRATKAEEERGQAIANAILDAPETTVAVADVVARARDAGYKVGYTKYLTHVNVVSDKKFTDEQCPLPAVDTEAELKAATDAYNALVVPALAQVEECLAADDYVDRLRGLFEPKEGAEGENEYESRRLSWASVPCLFLLLV
ncbi:hypothetical protein HanPI659440_Chr03g0131921 [Helianthus annuus]|nr:hypothetical protein HanPI659440_Chr03g0131921 [Helianthus annuus]